MWTVVFCPKVEYYLGNVDTKIVTLDFGVHITSTLRKRCPQKVPTISMDILLWTGIFNGQFCV